MRPEPTILNCGQLAERLGVAPETIRTWVRAGRVPSLRPSAKTLRFDYEAVLAALACREGRGVDDAER